MQTRETLQRSVSANLLMNFLLKLSGTLFAAISYPYAFRALGGEGIGKVAFTASIASFFVMLASMGIPTYGIRECARVRDNRDLLRRTVSELLRLQLLTTLLSELFLFAAVGAVPRLRGEWRLFLIQSGMLLFHGLDTEWLFSALERYDFLAIRSVGTRLLSLLLIIGFVHTPEDYFLYAVFTVVPTVLGNAWNIWAANRYLDGMGGGNRSAISRHLRTSLVFFAQAAAITVYTNLDAVLLGFFHTDEVVGMYDAAVKMKLVLAFFVTSLGTVLFPRFSYYAAEGREQDLERGARLSADFVLVTALPLSVFFIILAPECLSILYGTVESETLNSLRLLLPTLVLIGCSNLTGIQLLTPLGREKAVMWSVIAGAAVDFAADLLLVPKWGGPGAALGTLLAEITVLAVQIHAMRSVTVKPFDGTEAVRVAAVSLAAGVLFPLIRGLVAVPLLRVGMGTVLYFGAVYVVLLLLREPLMVLIWEKIREFGKITES